MHFPERLKVKVDKETGKVRLSIKVNEDTVMLTECKISEFEIMIAEYKAQIEESE